MTPASRPITPAALKAGRSGLSVVMIACHEETDAEDLEAIVNVLLLRHPRFQAPGTLFTKARKKPPAPDDEPDDEPDEEVKAAPLITNARILLGAEKREWFEYGPDAATSFAAISEAASRCEHGLAVVPVVGPGRCGTARLVAEQARMRQPAIVLLQHKDKVATHGRAFAECVIADTAYGEVTHPVYDHAVTYAGIPDAVDQIATYVNHHPDLAAPRAPPNAAPPKPRAPRESQAR